MEIDLRNERIIEELNSFLDEFYEKKGNNSFSRFHSDDYDASRLEERCSENVLKEQYLPCWFNHAGFPVEHCAVPIGDLDMKEWAPFWWKWKRDFTDKVGANQNTLINYYQGDGMVGWHTNYPSAGYQIVLSWSETGDGAFLYYDYENDKVVEVPDKAGWQARWYYFGPKESDQKYHCWHAMWTRCDRFTLCYNWALRPESYTVGTSKNTALKNLMLDYVDELETP